MNYIDIHAHILPGVDDGPSSWQESIEIAQHLCSQGVSRVLATPHVMFRNFSSNFNIPQLCTMLNDKIRQRGIDLEVIPGAELYIEPFYKFDQSFYGNFTMGDSKYLLIEFSLNSKPHNWEEFRFQAELSGYNLIIAHPERYHGVNLDWMEMVAAQGTYLQANAASFLGHYGKIAKQLAFRGIVKNLFQFIASDIHNITTRKSYFSNLGELLSEQKIKQLCSTNPDLLLKNQDIPIKPSFEESSFNNSIIGSLKNLLS
ncbi:MAG: tyrosine-protein phosphatase [bacterium]